MVDFKNAASLFQKAREYEPTRLEVDTFPFLSYYTIIALLQPSVSSLETRHEL